MIDANAKPVFWVGSARSDLRAFPEEVRTDIGFALWVAQQGGRPAQAKPLSVGDTYRVVYTVRFKEALYVLHAFQKKAKRGIKTPKYEVEMIRERLKAAEEHYGRR